MDRSAFFRELRNSPAVFGATISVNEQVIGIEVILDTCIRLGISNEHHVAHILAHVYHETGSYMYPIKETVFYSHKDKNPSDQTVINRLNNAFVKGQLKWVKSPYWRDGWFGRGQIQITHKSNYKKLGDAIGIDLVANRDAALLPEISAAIAVVGMSLGLFTGKKLSDYNFPSALDADPEDHPRRIVNGEDGTDDKIKTYHMAFYKALIAGNYASSFVAPAPTPVPPIPTPQPTVKTRDEIITAIRLLLIELENLGG